MIFRRRRSAAPVSLVLSGGGSRASFQLGALRYLYDEARITPSVIAGASVGSVLGSVLAQYPDHAGQRAALAQLDALWRSLQASSDIFTEQEWFARLRDQGSTLMETISELEERHQRRRRPFSWRPPREQAPLASTAAAVDAIDPTADDRPGLPFASLDVVDLVAAIKYLARARPDLETIIRGAGQEQSLYRLGPVLERVLDPGVFAPARLLTSGVVLRVAVVGLESGELRYVTQDGRLLDRDGVPVAGAAPVDVVDAVRASCTIPGVFAPVRLGDEHYVDGGVREVLPVEAVLGRGQVDRCYAVLASAQGVPREASYATRDLLSIVLRATMGIMGDEVVREEAARAPAAGAVVIVPEIDVHDAMVVDPGLTAIAMDYGWSRAAQAVGGSDAAGRRAVREIIELRRRTWAWEVALLGPETSEERASAIEALETLPTDNPARRLLDGVGNEGPDAAGLAALKRELRDRVAGVPSRLLPPEAGAWWRHWEGHPFPLPDDVPWLG